MKKSLRYDLLRAIPTNIRKRARFWQFCSCDKSTRTGHATHVLLPRRLVAPLEEYLGQHRPLFVKGRDPGNLFLNQNGSAFDASSFTRLVGALTRHHIGKRVTPGGFRHSFALKWSEERPMDILTLSKILRLRSVWTPFETVGPPPNEALCIKRVEEWIERRKMAPVTKDLAFVRLPGRQLSKPISRRQRGQSAALWRRSYAAGFLRSRGKQH
jgi:hypothetical protein